MWKRKKERKREIRTRRKKKEEEDSCGKVEGKKAKEKGEQN